MKHHAITLAALLAATPALAQMKGMEHHGTKGMDHGDTRAAQNAGTVHKATGTVTKPPANGKATIRHDPVASLKWPAMTMVFVVKDKSVADKLKPGQKIEFEFVQDGRDYLVTSVK